MRVEILEYFVVMFWVILETVNEGFRRQLANTHVMNGSEQREPAPHRSHQQVILISAERQTARVNFRIKHKTLHQQNIMFLQPDCQ